MGKRLTEQLIKEFKDFENKFSSRWDPKLIRIKQDAFKIYIKNGFPTRKDEKWRHTNLSFLNKHNYKLYFQPKESNISSDDVEKSLFDNINKNVIVFVNGFFSKELSRIVSNGNRIQISSLAEAFESGDEEVLKHFNKNLSNPNDTFTALNTAFSQDGAYVNIADGAVLETPIHFMYLNDTKSASILTMPRNLIIAGENSQAKIVQTVQTIGEHASFTNLYTEIVGKNACNIDFSKVQLNKNKTYYIGTTQANLYKDSTFHNATFSFNGDFVRNNLNIIMNDEGADTNLYGFYFLQDRDFVDNHTLIDHAKPNCTSNELYKGIMDDKSHAVFNGRVLVRKDAQKTRAYQTNRNVLLTNDVEINTKPELEIYADDVKCSHGATTGQLNNEAMFYMRSRGIDENIAEALLLNAFASDVVDKINIAQLRNHVKSKIAERLKMNDVYFCNILPIDQD